MARREQNPRFLASGLLVIDKPPSLTSTEVLNRVKRLTRPQRIGHTGTLDPFATGVLVLCFNQATKIAGYLLEDDKVYEGVMRLGIETDTLDLTGQVVQKRPVEVSPEEVAATAEGFRGVYLQKPPAYSALKQNGEPLYQKARRGEIVETAPREVTIHRLEITRIELPRVHFEVHCGKGTYIRSLARDWGRRLGCGGHLEALRRLQAGPFRIEEALILGQVESMAAGGRLARRLIPPEKALAWPGVKLDEEGARKVVQGQALEKDELSGLTPSLFKAGQKIKLINSAGELIALAEMDLAKDGQRLQAQPIRVLQV